MSERSDTRVVLIEDSPHYRKTLGAFFQHAGGFELVATFGSADALLRAMAMPDGGPDFDLALMDIELPGTNGIEATRRIKATYPDRRIVMVTVFEDPSVILEAISAGADGYLLKKSSAKEILEQLAAIGAGGAALTSGVARTLVELVRKLGSDELPAPPLASSPARLDLTDREQEALRCLVNGMSYQRTADELGITIHTVRHHIRSIYKKLQVNNVAEAVSRAVRLRLL